MAIERSNTSHQLPEIIERVLTKGLVIGPYVRISAGAVEQKSEEPHVLGGNIDSYLKRAKTLEVDRRPQTHFFSMLDTTIQADQRQMAPRSGWRVSA